MSEQKTGSGTFGKILRHPLLYWIILWTALGFGLTEVFKRIEIIGPEGASASAWQLANFLILVTALYYFAKDPLKEFLLKRRTEIKGNIDEAVKTRENFESSYQDYEYKMEWIEDEIAGIESKLREEGERERNRLLEEAEKQIERIRNEAEFTARQEVKAAEARLTEEAIRRALKLAEEILKAKLGDEDEKRLLEEYLREVASGGQN